MTLDFLIAVLAVYRVATDVAREAGPADAFGRLRGWVMVRFGADSWQFEGVSCPICLSFWLALPAAAALTLAWGAAWAWLPLLWLGLAGGAAFLARVR